VFRHLHRRIFHREDRSSLWKNSDFLNLWGSETISQFGSQISLLAIPLLAAITLDATPLEMGILGAAGGFPRLILGFLAGPWVDRHRKRPLMIATDLGRALIVLAIPVAAWLDKLTIGLLMVVAILIGMMSVYFNTAYTAIVPVLVERRQLGDANGKLMSSYSLAQAAGPAIAGTLMSVFSAPLVMLMNAVTYLWSGWFIRHIKKPEPPPPVRTEQHHFRQEILDGFRVLIASPILKATTTCSVAVSLSGNMFLAVYVLYMTNDLHLSSSGIGLVYASGGIGSLLGTFVSGWFAKQLGVGPTIVWSSVACGLLGIAVPMAILVPDHALPLIVFAECFQWMALMVHDVNRVSLRQALTPDHLQGRVSASTQALYGGAQTIGLLAGGVVGDLFGVRVALIVGIAGMFAASWFVWASPTRDVEIFPAEPDPLFATM
jgi:MFS family permease